MSDSNRNGKPPDEKPESTPIGGVSGGSLKKDWAKPFLDALEKYANIAGACRIANISEVTVYRDRKKDKAFKEAWDQRLSLGIASLEMELRRRALHGTDEDIFGKEDQVIGTRTKYSDTLGMFLLKAHRPQVYRDNITMEMRHSGDIIVRFAGMTVEEKKIEIADRLRGLLAE